MYWVGIIDILQKYDASKAAERAAKLAVINLSQNQPDTNISSIAAPEYCERFMQFIEEHCFPAITPRIFARADSCVSCPMYLPLSTASRPSTLVSTCSADDATTSLTWFVLPCRAACIVRCCERAVPWLLSTGLLRNADRVFLEGCLQHRADLMRLMEHFEHERSSSDQE